MSPTASAGDGATLPGSFDADRSALQRLAGHGWRPRCIFDIGASNGGWTFMAAQMFPLTEFHLFEPLATRDAGYHAGLDRLIARTPFRATVHSVALDAQAGSASFGISPSPVGSSLLAKTTSAWFPTVIEVQTATLDDYRASRGLPFPELIKIDTQGSELRILKGALETLARVEVLLLETWLVRGYGAATPLLHELSAWLAQRGFLAVEMCGSYRDREDRLVSQDVMFAREGVLGDG